MFHKLRTWADRLAALEAPTIESCECSVPDFVGYQFEPEHWRCLICGHYPNATAQIQVRLLVRRKVPHEAYDGPAPSLAAALPVSASARQTEQEQDLETRVDGKADADR